jgi:hypothetical protein
VRLPFRVALCLDQTGVVFRECQARRLSGDTNAIACGVLSLSSNQDGALPMAPTAVPPTAGSRSHGQADPLDGGVLVLHAAVANGRIVNNR